MRTKYVLGIVVALFISLSYANPAPAANYLTAPVITLADNAKSVIVRPAKWPSSAKASFKWLLNGKVVTGSKLSFTPTAKQKGATLQYSESSGKTTVLSNKYVIGQVFIASEISIAFTDDSKKY